MNTKHKGAKNMAKKILTLLLSFLLITLITLTANADQGQQGKLRWTTPPSGTYDGGPHTFDIQCLIDGVLGTTFNNAGYIVQFKSDFIKTGTKTINIKPINNGSEVYIIEDGTLLGSKPEQECVGVKILLYFDSDIVDNNYIRVKYTVTNYTGNPITCSLGTGADIQIGDNDRAEVKTLKSDAGFTMIEGDQENSLQYVFFGRDTEQFDVTDVDSIWIGGWQPSFYNTYLFSNQFQDLKGVDSAFAYAWNNRNIPASESREYEVVFLIDHARNVILPGEVAKPTASPTGSYSNSSITVTLNCSTPGASIYYTTDGSEPTSESLLYEAPFVLDQSTTVKAIAIKEGSYSEIMTEI